jgi:hypothetical protein
VVPPAAANFVASSHNAKKLRLPVFHSYFLFVASSHKICGKEGSLIVWLLVVPVYDVTPPTAKLGPARMFQM